METSNIGRRLGINPSPDSPFVSDARDWIAHLQAKGLSAHTLRRTDYSLRKLALFLEQRGTRVSVQDVTCDDIDLWRASLSALQSPQAVEVALRKVAAFFSWLLDEGRLFSNPCATVTIVAATRGMQSAPTEDEMVRLLRSIAGRDPIELRDRAMLETAYSCGFRCSELAGMQVESVDLQNQLARVQGKGSKERMVPLTRAAVHALKHYLSKGRPLLLGNSQSRALWLNARDSRGLGRGSMSDIVRGRGAAVGIPITLHAIRRAFATHLLQHGTHPAELKELLGHASYTHLKHYLRYAITEVRDTHQRSRLGR